MNCQQCKDKMPDYIKGNLTEEEEQRLEQHLLGCPECSQMYSSRRRPASILKGLSLRGWASVVIVLILLIGAAYLSGLTDRALTWWNGVSVADNENLKEIKRFGIGNALNLEKEDNGIKVTITHVVADDIQTYVYYEVEDLEGDRLLSVEDSHRPTITAETGTFDITQGYGEQITGLVPADEQPESRFRGRIGLLPIKEEKATIELEINRLTEIEPANMEEQMLMAPMEDRKRVEGNWSFEIPIEKQEIIDKEINMETELDGHEVKISKIRIAPTMTLLQYGLRMDDMDSQVSYVSFGALASNEMTYKPDYTSMYPGNFPNRQSNWMIQNSPFQSMYYDPPDSLDVKVERIETHIVSDKEYPLDPDRGLPQTFTFLDSDFEVEINEINEKTQLTIKTEWNRHREFDRLHFEVISEPENTGMMLEEKGVFVKPNGEVYEMDNYNEYPSGVENAHYYQTEAKATLESRGTNGEIRPIAIKIYSYQKSVFPNETINLEF
ncbi:DUF4179 domain-containing protein [Sediminibacillus massiliensis]|uniref:DUF4179 domain-containing protein n=1 Tax=Sediminibacillus massiliensis TaxID=1926277 RepID=UPI0015C395EE|nr:DUF4179 domain-containing protein [Sediminibacillus massiliensis]